MQLSYTEIMNLIRKEQVKHQDALKSDSIQVNKSYSRNAFFAMRDFEKAVRKHFGEKYP